MYQVLAERLHEKYYCNEIKGFINYVLSNPKKLLVEVVLDVHVKGVKKKFSIKCYYDAQEGT
jgi:hypothetical protein